MTLISLGGIFTSVANATSPIGSTVTSITGSLSGDTALPFLSTDTLSLDGLFTANNVSITSNGIITTLGVLGTSLSLPDLAFSQASQNGGVLFADGTRLLAGTIGGNLLTGGASNDAFYGFDGDDTFSSGDGHDYAFGGAGADTIRGGEGNDHLYGYASTAGPDGSDEIHGDAGDDYIQGNSGADRLHGGEGHDRIVGGADDDVLYGGEGNESMNGNMGDDRLEGGTGADVLRGGKGADVIIGGQGNDIVQGDLGADMLSGGSDADIFVFRGSDAALLSTNTLLMGPDEITDFEDGSDHISLGYMPTNVLHGEVIGGVAAILPYAGQLLGGSTEHSVASLQVGNDTYLAYSSGGGLLVDSIVKIDNLSNELITASDFV